MGPLQQKASPQHALGHVLLMATHSAGFSIWQQSIGQLEEFSTFASHRPSPQNVTSVFVELLVKRNGKRNFYFMALKKAPAGVLKPISVFCDFNKLVRKEHKERRSKVKTCDNYRRAISWSRKNNGS